MANLTPLWHRLWRVLLPTPTQAMTAIILALVGLVAIQSRGLLQRLGINDQTLEFVRQNTLQHFGSVLTAPLVSNIALIAFWAAIGLVAYLLCWGVYNAWVAARNEVTIETQYTNKGHWQGVVETLTLKAVAALLLALYLIVFQYGLALWLALSAGLLVRSDVGAFAAAGIAALGFAAQLYGCLVLIQLVITPWYRREAFTDVEK